MITLKKGQKVSLTKEAPNLKKMVVGLGWDVNSKVGGGLFSMFSGSGGSNNYDLDASAIICRNGKYVSKKDLVYFGNLKACDEAVVHNGDNLTGAGDGDDEQITIDISRLPSDVDKIVIIVNIYSAKARKQDFGQIKNAFIRIVDTSDDSEVCKYNLSEDYSGCRGMIFGELYKKDNEWKFNPIGEGIKEDTISEIARRYE